MFKCVFDWLSYLCQREQQQNRIPCVARLTFLCEDVTRAKGSSVAAGIFTDLSAIYVYVCVYAHTISRCSLTFKIYSPSRHTLPQHCCIS